MKGEDTMHCEQVTLKSGQNRWICIEDGPKDPATGKRKQIRRRGKTKKEAKKKIEDEIRKIEIDGLTSKKRRTLSFEQVSAEWLKTYEASGNKRSSVRIKEKDLKVLNRYMAKTPIDKITHSMYQKFLNDLPNHYALNSIKSINTTANMVFKYAIRDKLIKDNPRTDAIIPKKKKTIEEVRENPIEGKYLDHDELNQFFSVLHNHALTLDIERFYTLAFSGMRPGELCALQKPDLDFTNQSISIYKTLYAESNNMREYTLTPPKTTGSVRVIDMETPIMELLKKLCKENDKRNLKLRTVYEDFHDKDFVFSRPNGYPFITKNVLDRMDRLIAMTNIKKRATPHIFRHTHISMLTEAGVDIATIMQRVGHEDVATTMQVYTHVTNKMKKDAPAKVNNLYGNIFNKFF